MNAIAIEKTTWCLGGSIACAITFAALFWFRADLCHVDFPLTYSLILTPLVGMGLGGVALFNPNSRWSIVIVKLAVIAANLWQLGMGLLALTGMGLAQCG